jgi:chromosomal replication initiator protein
LKKTTTFDIISKPITKKDNLTEFMNKTAQSVWENCLSFIKDNIQDQTYKTWFEPIKSVEHR